MDFDIAYKGFLKLNKGNIPSEVELQELYSMASQANVCIDSKVSERDFVRWSKCSPLIKCLGLMESYKMIISRVDESPEISTYLVFKSVTINNKENIGPPGKIALEFFLTTYGLREFDINRHIEEYLHRN